MNILKKTILLSGALTRSLIGIGAAVLLFCTLKKRRKSTEVPKSPPKSTIVPKFQKTTFPK